MQDVFIFLYFLCSFFQSSQLRNQNKKTSIWKNRNVYQRCKNEHGILEGAINIHGDVIEQIDMDWHYVRGLEAMDSCTYYCFEAKKFVVKFGVTYRRWKLDDFPCYSKGGVDYPNYGFSICIQCFYSKRSDKLYNCRVDNFVLTERNLTENFSKEITKYHGKCLFHAWPDSKGKFWYNYRTLAGLTCFVKADLFQARFKMMRWSFNGIEIIHPKRVPPCMALSIPGKNESDIDTFLEELASRFANHQNKSYAIPSRTLV